MPQRDGTGPAGKGAGTGRGQGDCNTGGGCLSLIAATALVLAILIQWAA